MSSLFLDMNDRFLVDAAKRMLEDGHPIRFICLNPDYKDLGAYIGDSFERHGAVLLDERKFSFAANIRRLNEGTDRALSGALIKEFYEAESYWLMATDRLRFFPSSVRERKALYYELLLYWYHFLRDEGIRNVVFGGTPHMGWDVLVYHVARRLGLRTVMFNPTLIPERVVFWEDLETREKVPAEFLRGKSLEELKLAAGPELCSEIGKPSTLMAASVAMNNQVSNGVRFELKKVLRFLKAGGKPFYNSTFFHHDSLSRNWQLALLYVYFHQEQTRILRLYQSLTAEPDLSGKFVFFALHMQPERTTLPEGGVFEEQLLALRILSLSIPDDWTLYVKEHPSQFIMRFQGRNGRTHEYYRSMAAIPKVKLVGIQVPSAGLARGSQFTSTITGSIGWESLLIGKPCVTFGKPWYFACNSCYLVDSLEDARKAVADILSKGKAEVEADLLRWLAYQRDRFEQTSFEYDFAIKSPLGYDKLVGNLARRLAKEIEAGAPRPASQD